MDKMRKDIIIKEIQYWKEHRLLPEHYCNFLLTLYTEGSAAEQQEYEKKSPVFKVKKFFYFIFLAYLVFQLPTTLVIIYFTELNILLQTVLFTFFVLTCVYSFYFFNDSKNSIRHLPVLIGLLILFLASNQLITTFYKSNQLVLLINVMANCLLWLGIGYFLKFKYLIISGVVSAIILIAYKLL